MCSSDLSGGELKPGNTRLPPARPSQITVGHVLRMQSGIPDFDQPDFDKLLLLPNETYLTHSPFEFIENAAAQKIKLLFEPGTQVGRAGVSR